MKCIIESLSMQNYFGGGSELEQTGCSFIQCQTQLNNYKNFSDKIKSKNSTGVLLYLK